MVCYIHFCNLVLTPWVFWLVVAISLSLNKHISRSIRPSADSYYNHSFDDWHWLLSSVWHITRIATSKHINKIVTWSGDNWIQQSRLIDQIPSMNKLDPRKESNGTSHLIQFAKSKTAQTSFICLMKMLLKNTQNFENPTPLVYKAF